MSDQVASMLPAGAGRFLDYVYPDETISSVGASAQFRGRNGVTQLGGTIVTFGAGSGQVTGVVPFGVAVQQLFCVAGGGNQRLFYPGFPVLLRTTRSKISQYVDDCSVYRILFTMSGQGIAVAANRDFGFTLSRFQGAGGGGSRVEADAAPGIMIRLQNTAILQLVIRGPNGLVVTDITPAGWNSNLVLHTFDMRLFSATETADAYWTLRIDGSLVALSAANGTWGVGTNLPDCLGVGGAAITRTVGFVPSVVNDAGAAMSLFVYQVRMIAAPTELMTL